MSGPLQEVTRQGQRKKARRRRIATVILAIVLVGVGLVAGALSGPHLLKQKTAAPPEALASSTVTRADWKGAYYFENSALVVTDADMLEGLKIGLADIDTLRKWGLCSIELKAEAQAERGLILAGEEFPANKPFNYEQDSWDDAHLAVIAGRVAVLSAGADLAATANIPCAADKNPLIMSVVYIIVSDGGVNLAITAEDVMRDLPPLEEAIKAGQCASRVEAERTKLAAKAPDTQVNTSDPSLTLGEGDKVVQLTRYDALIGMLRAAQPTNC